MGAMRRNREVVTGAEIHTQLRLPQDQPGTATKKKNPLMIRLLNPAVAWG